MPEPKEHYRATAVRVLSGFQLLEFALKAYIGRCYEFTRKALGDKLHFGYSAKDVEDFPLERLLNVFAKFNTNSELIARLNKLRTERNHIAHKSLLITMGPLCDRGAVEDKYIEFSILEDEVTECLQLVIQEARALKERARGAA